MKITILGTSGGIPIPNRAQSGILVEASGKKILLDCGMGVPLRLAEAGVQAEEIDLVCLTHGHLDHIQDLPSLTKAAWLRTGAAEYRLIIPPKLSKTLKEFWKSVDEYERSDLDFEVLGPGENIDETFMIEPFETEHTEMSQGYKISDHSSKVVYTGDTEPLDGVRQDSEEADLLIHELSYMKKAEGHTDPDRFISTFSGSSAGKFIMTHFYPEIEDNIKDITTRIEKETSVPTRTAEDLMTIVLSD